MKMVKKLARLGLVIPIVIVLGACGSPVGTTPDTGDNASDGSVIEQLNALPQDQQRAKAMELAKAEGELSLYTENPEEVYTDYTAAFTEATGVSVTVFRASSVTLNQKILQELEANRLGVDVLIGSYGPMMSMAEQDALAKYEGSGVNNLGDDPYFDGGWLTAAAYVVAPIWNTDLIPAGEEPKSWEDLADPKYDGKLSVAAEDGDIFGIISTIWLKDGKSQSEIDDLWKEIVDGAHAATGHTAMTQLLGAGQTAINAWNYSFIADSAIDNGAPVTYRSEGGIAHTPTFAYPLGMALFKDAKHPASAWLWHDWFMNEGQDVMVKHHFLTAEQAAGEVEAEGLTLLPFPYEVEDNVSEWNDKWDALLRGVPVVDQPAK